MKLAVAILLTALMLAGCADGYDKSAVSSATAEVHQATEGCKARLAASDIKTYSEIATCSLAAERAFFMAIKLEKMDKFEAYATSYQTLAAARDAHCISDRQASRGANEILREFYEGCRCEPAQRKFGPVPPAEPIYWEPALPPPPAYSPPPP